MNAERSLLPGAFAGSYITHPLHYLNAKDAHVGVHGNIGRFGTNITISFLSLNRASLSCGLLASIAEWLPSFAGEVLIIDQGSGPEELQRIRAAADRLSCRWRLVQLDKNYGVAGGRNRTMEHVETDWVMCLDNDMVFMANPLPQIQADIGQLGCHFLNLPLLDHDRTRLFARGGHLYTEVSNGDLFVGGGSAYQPVEHDGEVVPAFLSTFLFGGASVLRVETFQQIGGYDENMFVGFEDTDFSIELFQRGYKVGNTGMVAIVHDHPPPAADADVDYEKQRYSREILKRSAEYLERKRGITVWSPVVDEWLENRRGELGLSHETVDSISDDNPLQASKGQLRIALLVRSTRSPEWSLAQAWLNDLAEQCSAELLVADEFEDRAQVFFAASRFDLVHCFSLELGGELFSEQIELYCKNMHSSHERFLGSVTRPIYSVGVDAAELPEELGLRFLHEVAGTCYLTSEVHEAWKSHDLELPQHTIGRPTDCVEYLRGCVAQNDARSQEGSS